MRSVYRLLATSAAVVAGLAAAPRAPRAQIANAPDAAAAADRDLDTPLGFVAASAGEIAAQAERFVGRSLSVRAEVERVYGPHLFTLDEDGAFAGPDVLVVVPDGTIDGAIEDHEVVVLGPLRRFVRAEIERDRQASAR